MSIGIHDIVQDPKFVDIANNDYKLKPDSPCIGAGDDGKNMGYWQNGGEKMTRVIVGVNFEGESEGSIAGKIVVPTGVDVTKVTVNLTGNKQASVNPDVNGNYLFDKLSDGTYDVNPVLEGLKFEYTGAVSRPIVIPSA